MTPEYTILTILVVVAVILMYMAAMDIRYVQKIKELNNGVNLELARRVDAYKIAAARSDLAAQMFANILLDLANTKNKDSLYWKLMTVRHVELVMQVSGWNDGNMFEWMKNHLYCGSRDDYECECNKTTWIDRIEKIVQGYYIMDMEEGSNICNVLRLLSNLSAEYNDKSQDHVNAEKDLMELIDALHLSFAMYDSFADRKPEHQSISFEEMLKDLDTISDTTVGVQESTTPTPAVVEDAIPGGDISGYQEVAVIQFLRDDKRTEVHEHAESDGNDEPESEEPPAATADLEEGPVSDSSDVIVVTNNPKKPSVNIEYEEDNHE